ncbi:MAG: DUF1592 domain-containing protein, partial [Pirellulaceae bacterium]|nr:DUF1592 domain-containing protein [Pirellulaceae bacterium]
MRSNFCVHHICWVVVLACMSTNVVGGDQPTAIQTVTLSPESATHFRDTIRPILVNVCGKCHAPDDEEDAVRFLRDQSAADISQHRGLWSSVAEQLRNRTMPPADSEQPSEEERRSVAQWIDRYLTRTACEQADFAGNPITRRLNRDQYTYAIEDLTGIQFDFVETFPADGGGGEGFDNNGETLFLPPLLMERYLEVAQRVIDDVIVTKPLSESYVTVRPGERESIAFIRESEFESGERGKIQPGEVASLVITINTDDEYTFAVKANHDHDDRANLVLRIDGLDVKTLPISRNTNAPPKWTQIHFSRGVHQIDLSVPIDSAAMEIEFLRLEQETGDKNARRKRQAATEKIFRADAQRLDNDDPSDDLAAVTDIVRSFARQAWRRPVGDDELDRLMTLYARGIARGETIAQAIKLPLKTVLVSPHFLFMVEQGHTGRGIHRISDLELASRLSFFLWHSLPDETLLDLAQTGVLHRPDVLRDQTERMLADERAYRFSDAFASQWLGTIAVGRTVIPDTNFFQPAYNTDLVLDLRRQVGETMHWMVQNDRSATEWLDADYVIVNKRLAEHYKIKPVPKHNHQFEKITAKDSPRSGIFGLGAVHMLTSYARRTSPVLRGGWV